MHTDIDERVRAARSWLFTPGDRPDRFASAERSGADGVILDLEDAVAPGHKVEARGHVWEHLQTRRDTAVVWAVRINGPSTPEGRRDVAALRDAPVRPDVVVVPKVESADELGDVAGALDTGGSRTALVPIVESAKGVRDLPTILAGSCCVTAVLVGAADLAADLGALPEWEPLAASRSAIRIATAAVGLPLIDSPFFDLHDASGLNAETFQAIRFGFDAKAAIHPAQLSVVNNAFMPTHEQISWARQVLEVSASGVGTVDDQMIDEAVARRARKILSRTG